MTSTKSFHLPSLDGIRAIAVLLVFVSHAGWGYVVPGGFGVTVFFFLSGFLITTLLRREYDHSGRINFRNFYLRRIYRILPPMYFVLFSILILGIVGVVENSANIGGVMAQIFQVTNYYIITGHESGWVFSTATFWSLAVEEHFYILFPLLLVFCLKRWRNSDIAKIFSLICFLELIWRCVLVFGYNVPTDRTYMGTDTRFDSLLFGCIMGLWMNPVFDEPGYFKEKWAKAGLFLFSIMILLITFVFRSESFRETFRYTLQGVALFPIFWLAVRCPEWRLFRILNTRVLRFIGAISYVFYLSHLFFLNIAHSMPWLNLGWSAIVAFAMTVAFSYAVQVSIERPFADLRRRLQS